MCSILNSSNLFSLLINQSNQFNSKLNICPCYWQFVRLHLRHPCPGPGCQNRVPKAAIAVVFAVPPSTRTWSAPGPQWPIPDWSGAKCTQCPGTCGSATALGSGHGLAARIGRTNGVELLRGKWIFNCILISNYSRNWLD
jgi:hypothetical protein